MALTTKEKIKAMLGGTINASENTILDLIAAGASAYVLSVLDYDPILTTYTEERDGNGGASIALSVPRIRTVTSVVSNGVTVPPAPDFTSNGYVIDKTNGILHYRGGRWPQGFQNIVVSYTAGFDVYPADLELAATDIGATKFKKRSTLGIQSKTLANETITYSDNDVGPMARATLNEYVRRYFT